MIDIAGSNNPSAVSLAGRVLAMGWALHAAGNRAVEVKDDAMDLMKKGLADDRGAVKMAACGYLF